MKEVIAPVESFDYPRFHTDYFKRFGAIKQFPFTPSLLAERCSPLHDAQCADITMVTQLTYSIPRSLEL